MDSKLHIFYDLARKRQRSDKDYLAFEAFQGSMVVSSLRKKGMQFKGKKVLDIGCGLGGYSRSFLKEGARVTCLDLSKDQFQPQKGLTFVQGDATHTNFPDKSFDFVFCSSLIEHVKNPDKLIKEIRRVLKPAGYCYISFPPFWSPVGGHQFKPFHYFGEKIAVKLAHLFYGVKDMKYEGDYGRLYVRTIGQLNNLLKKNNLNIISVTTRMLPFNTAWIPFFKELLTWHAEFLAQKPK